jgi:hypothetical protein
LLRPTAITTIYEYHKCQKRAASSPAKQKNPHILRITHLPSKIAFREAEIVFRKCEISSQTHLRMYLTSFKEIIIPTIQKRIKDPDDTMPEKH